MLYEVITVPLALDRAADLIQKLAGGVVSKGRIDAYPSAVSERKITLTIERTNKIP